MDNIRTTLQVLFLQQKSEAILDSLYGLNPEKRLDISLNAEWFRRTFREVHNGYTLDQIEAIGMILKTGWMKNICENSLVSFAGNSVFNVLLHFGKEVLLDRNRQPVCRYESLLRWHDLASRLGEDLLTTSFLAAKDLTGRYDRNLFSWIPVIGHNNNSLNAVLRKRKADLHFHLKGSSLNFDLNWLSLMNAITDRDREFKILSQYQSPKLQMVENEQTVSLYLSAIKACAIRLFLFRKLENPVSDINEECELNKLLRCKTISEARLYLPALGGKLRSQCLTSGKRYGKDPVDYAIQGIFTATENTNPDYYTLSILSGERRLMYLLFRYIYGNNKNKDSISTLFYSYLVAKSQIRNELIQLNEKIGFGNFAHYESRKELFIREGSVYETLITNLAAGIFLGKSTPGNGNYLEARITPKHESRLLSASISKTDSAVLDKRFVPAGTRPGSVTGLHYILHFIKKKDQSNPKMFELIPRQNKLRNEVEKQAKAIARLRASLDPQAMRITGIDAANSEILCRPEVFAQAYRFLKYFQPGNRFDYIKENSVNSLGFTYHVGEDYMDITDGLRAVDEALIFLNLSHSDRLGHALALGTDPYHYYQCENKTVVMPGQIFLDNIAWLYIKIKEYGLQNGNVLCHKLKVWFESYFRQIFCSNGEPVTSIYTYYQSWLLRGDAPGNYTYEGTYRQNDFSGWNKHSLNFTEAVREARENREACRLYYRYHYDAQVKINGSLSSQCIIDENYISTVAQLQQAMLKDIESRHICIETNPTSNFRIGTFDKYVSHPITRFYNRGISTRHPDCCIPVSVNTDDQGIFCTCIEREFSLLAIALEKEGKNMDNPGNPPAAIYEWLDEIREMAFEQRFSEQ